MSETKVVHEDDRKIFVGALPQEANAICIREYFGSFGEVESINLKMDPVTGRSRGFAFVVFKDLTGLEAALVQTDHAVMGKKVTCKKAEARQGKIYVGKLPPGHALSKEELVVQGITTINEKVVEIKKVTPKPKAQTSGLGSN